MIYDLVKVIDPHKHMPGNIRASFFDGESDNDRSQNTFIRWTIGEEYGDDVDTWLLANGFSLGETVMILFWW